MTHLTQTHHFKYGNKERDYFEYTSLIAVLGADIAAPGEVFLDDKGWESFRHSGWRFFPRENAPHGKETALIVKGPTLYLFPNLLAGAFEPDTLTRVATEFGLKITSRLFGDIVTLARVNT